MREPEQLALLSTFVSKFKEEYETFPHDKTPIPHAYYINNGMFGSVDGEILYCMIRHFKPARIVEIGSGNSTYLAAQAITRNGAEDSAYRCELIAIEPDPNPVLRSGFPGLSQLLTMRLEDVPLSEFQRLKERDIFFIDSSHVLKTGGDVYYEYLEILPRLRNGVIVHAHDIFLPAEYPREWLIKKHAFYTEQYLLHAFLLFNHAYEVLWAAHYMHLRHGAHLEQAFTSYAQALATTLRDSSGGERWVGPGSFWMRRAR